MIEPIAESKNKKEVVKTDKKVVQVEREAGRDLEVEMMVRRKWTKEVDKLIMICFHQSDPTRRGYK